MWVRPNSPRLFVPGSPKGVISRLAFSSVPHSVYECVATGSRPRPICSDFLSLRPKRIGIRPLPGIGTAFSTPCAARFAWHVNTAAVADPDDRALRLLTFLRSRDRGGRTNFCRNLLKQDLGGKPVRSLLSFEIFLG